MKILLTTFGSLGDLHPYIAVGNGLLERGHSVTLATFEIYRAKVESEGLAFHALRPDMPEALDDPKVMRRAMHARTGTEYVVRKMILPFLEQTFEDTMAAVRDVNLIVSHPLAYAVPLASELTGVPWISIALAPMAMLSAWEPPPIPGMPFPETFRSFGPRFWRPALNLILLRVGSWGKPINRLRAKLGLPLHENPICGDMFSPSGTQAWFSRVMAQPQPDWPPNTAITGFPFFDRLETGVGMSAELHAFLETGPPPVVFTLGSAAVRVAGSFYEESARAARIAGVRAVLLTGVRGQNRLSSPPGDSVFVADYAPYSELFPRAAATVHQGGVGTTAQALRAGRPMLVVPFSHDQPDNARRVANLGVARVVRREKYRAELVARELQQLLSAPYAIAAKRVAGEMAVEDGVRAACHGLEALAAGRYNLTGVLLMETTRLSTKGQIVLPKSIRISRAWKPGTEFTVEETREGILLKPASLFPKTTWEEFDVAMKGIRERVAKRRKKPVTLAEMDAAITAEVLRRHARGRY